MDLKDCKIYLVTDEKACSGKDFYKCIEESIKGGVKIVQLREKNISTKDFLVNKLFKIADIITPNLDETKEIVKIILKNENIENIDSIEKMKTYGKIIANFTKKWVLIKGGHLSNSAVDILINREEIHILEGEKILSNNTHGTGCSLSSAIASNLAKGYPMLEAVKKAKNFVLYSIKNSVDFGEIVGTVNQMGEIYKNIDIEKLY